MVKKKVKIENIRLGFSIEFGWFSGENQTLFRITVGEFLSQGDIMLLDVQVLKFVLSFFYNGYKSNIRSQ